jgi:hypothetical protein
LAAEVEARRSCVQLTQHSFGQIDIDALSGLTTVNLLVKYSNTSSPLVAIVAMWSGVSYQMPSA